MQLEPSKDIGIVEDTLKLFFSYSHEDEALRERLGRHLRILEYQGLISSWHDRKILPGGSWDEQIAINQDTADIILLLISADFLASHYCWDIEMRRAMELHQSGKACVVPVILRAADWANAPFSRLQAVPKNAQPVTSFSNQDEAFQFITQQIRRVAMKLIEKRKGQREQQAKEAGVEAYRRKFQEFTLNDGEISLGERFILRQLQQEYHLGDLEVQEIERTILSPMANQENLDNYRQIFIEAIAQYGYPFTDKARRDLVLVQDHLGLSDVEVAQIEAPIIAQEQAKQQQTSPATEEIAIQNGTSKLSLENSVKSELTDPTTSSSNRKPARSYQELKEIALSNQVDELLSYLADRLVPEFFWSGTNRSSVTFSSKNNRKLLFSLNPVDSNLNKGLKFQVYVERLAEHLDTKVANLIPVLPECKIAWEAEWSGPVYEGFFRTLEEAVRFLSVLRERSGDLAEI